MSNRSSATIINNGNELTINCTKAENIVRPNKNGEYYTIDIEKVKFEVENSRKRILSEL